MLLYNTKGFLNSILILKYLLQTVYEIALIHSYFLPCIIVYLYCLFFNVSMFFVQSRNNYLGIKQKQLNLTPIQHLNV